MPEFNSPADETSAMQHIRLPQLLHTSLAPALVTLVAMLLLVSLVLASEGGDPLTLARLGTQYSLGDPEGTQGYDGQFVYYIGRDLHPEAVARFLDVPAYRYQRILLPLVARLAAFGDPQRLPWTLVLLGILAQTAGTFLVAELLHLWDASRWHALVYGLWVGFALAVRLDLPEPLAFALVAGALLAGERKKYLLSWILYGMALFAKEVTIAFLLAAIGESLYTRRWKHLAGLMLFAGLPYLVFQGWLWVQFGQPGLGSGGAMATSFEWIPFMGLLRIGAYSPLYLGAMLVVFAPAAVLPSVWGIWASLKKMLQGDINVVVLALLVNALLIASLPFSTYRETGGLLRFMCGLVLAVLLFGARYHMPRLLRYCWLWLVLDIFLIKTSIN
jgi:hypothetical protein